MEGLHAEGVTSHVVDHNVMDAQPLVVEAAKVTPGFCIVWIAPEVALIEIGRVLQICCLAGIAESGRAGLELEQGRAVLLRYGRDQRPEESRSTQHLSPASEDSRGYRQKLEPNCSHLMMIMMMLRGW